MARDYVADLKAIRAAIDSAVASGGVQELVIGGMSVKLSLTELR